MKNFTDRLTEEQIQIATEIADKAQKMGIDPRLAVALAFRESGLKPDAKGSKGEIGLMQVMPATAEGMGFSIEDLRNPSRNIDIGLTFLKQNLDKFGDPVLATAAYNAGPSHPFFNDPENKSLPASTEQYLSDIRDLGGFTRTPVATPASEEDFMANKLRLGLDLAGAASGAATGKALQTGKNIIGGASSRANDLKLIANALGMQQGMPTAAPQMPQMPPQVPQPSAPMSGARPAVGGPAGPVGAPAGPLTQMGGSGTYNYGKAFGLTDIEAGRATDMSKAPGGASDLIAKRSEALQKIQQMGGGYAENPRYGGIMTPQQGVGGGPRASFVQQSAIPPNPDLPSGKPGGLFQLPPSQPVSMTPQTPPRPSPLTQAAQMAKQGAGAVLRSPITIGALGGLSAAEGAQEFQNRMDQGDAIGMGLAGAQTVGGLMQMIPHPVARGIGAIVSTASPLTQYLRDKIKTQPELPEPTPEEIQRASRPAFVYPSP